MFEDRLPLSLLFEVVPARAGHFLDPAIFLQISPIKSATSSSASREGIEVVQLEDEVEQAQAKRLHEQHEEGEVVKQGTEGVAAEIERLQQQTRQQILGIQNKDVQTSNEQVYEEGRYCINVTTVPRGEVEEGAEDNSEELGEKLCIIMSSRLLQSICSRPLCQVK